MNRERGLPLLPWVSVLVLTVPLAIGALVTWYVTDGAIFFGDIDWYATALPSLTSDLPLYDPAKLQPHSQDRPPYWNQPPAAALLTLVMLLPRGDWILGFVMVTGVLVGLALMWPRVGPGGTVLLAPVLLLWNPVIEALAWANSTGLVFGLLAVAWRFPRLAGWAIGAAAAVKLVPILAVAWLLGKRDWRGAAIACGFLAVSTLVVVLWKGPSTVSDFILVRLNEIPSVTGFSRWSFASVLGLPPVAGYVAGAFLAVLAWRFASFSLAIVAMLVSVAALHAHYLTWILVPMLGAWLPWIISALDHRSRGLTHVRGHDPAAL